MKRVAFACLLLLITVPAVLAQDEKPESEAPQTSVELNRLYKQAGRAWGHRVIHWTRGESPEVETTKNNVTEFVDGVAEVNSETRSASGDYVGSTATLVTVEDVSDETKALVADSLPPETLDMGFRAFECRKHEFKADGIQVTTWTSTEFHPLVVKQVTFRGEYTEIRKLTSFNSAETDPWLLYRMVGRRWKLKMTTNFDDEESISYFENEVIASNDQSAKVKLTMAIGDEESVDAGESEVRFTANPTEPLPPEFEELPGETKTCEAGEFDCTVFKHGETVTWNSKQWPGLIVRQEGPASTMELVEFDLGHDFMKFYRTAGNTYTTKSTTKFQAMNIESSITYKVTKYEDGVSTYTMTSKDANGRQTFKNEMSLDVSEPDESLSPYVDQVEELIETPAGKFPALRTQMEETTTWMWHGIVVRMEMKMEDIEMTQELTELKME
ncbi:MAG: hypothetical protein R3E76_09115 [Planctomycetota bacterium]